MFFVSVLQLLTVVVFVVVVVAMVVVIVDLYAFGFCRLGRRTEEKRPARDGTTVCRISLGVFV